MRYYVKTFKKILSTLLLGVISLSSSSSFASSNIKDIDSLEYNITLFEDANKEDVETLFREAKKDTKQNKGIKKDKNGNEVYQIEKILGKYSNAKGETLETREITNFHKIEDPLKVNTRSAVEDGEWDSSTSAYIYSRVEYNKVVYNNRDSVKISKVTGGVTNFSSPLRISKLKVTMGQSSAFPIVNQSTTKDFGSTTSYTMYPNFNWVPVPANFGSYGSVVGANTQVNFVRGNSSWFDYFVNNLR